MNTLPFARMALLAAAALGSGIAIAQTTRPNPAVMSDVAPLPAENRSSLGAVVLTDSPVIAQREMASTMTARTQQLMTSVMGAGPAVPVKADTDEAAKSLSPAQPARK